MDKIMKKLFLLALIPAFALSCGQRAKKAELQETALTLKDSIQLVEGMGKVVEDIYEGLIPAADTPGQDWVLTFYHQEFAPTGVYHLAQTFREAAGDGSNETFESTGTWETLLTESHPVYILREYATGSVVAFTYKGDTIEMLDQEMNPIESEHNYTLQRRLQNAKVE